MLRTMLIALIITLPLATPLGASAGEQTRFRDYFEALPKFWDKIYAKGGETLYCAKQFGSRRGRNINIEHVYPMAWAMRAERCRNRQSCRRSSPRFNRMEADMHNFYPSLMDINKARSSFPFGILKGEKRRFGRCDFEVDPRQKKAEPRPEVRGNIARAMFHMHDSYDLKIYAKQGRMLQQWHRQDPTDRNERQRNDRIEKIQGTRNRFIDNPKAADTLRF